MINKDTIAAIATPLGSAGVSIIRISGKDSFKIAEKIFKSRNRTFSDLGVNTITHGFLVDPKDNREVDEILISKMKAPKTYTGEDTVEINCHGGIGVTKEILNIVINNGARLAEGGEFTKRAFFNGKIDLVQAEAVSDIITARTKEFKQTAFDSLKGKLSKRIGDIKEDIIKLLSHLEVTIQYPEYDIEDLTDEEIVKILITIKEKLQKLLATFDKGEILKDGVNIAIIGKPNVGKSMLLNDLLGSEKAIVTDEAGTTRDVIDEVINIGGIPVKLFDTAGIRDTSLKVEKIGIEKSKDLMKSAKVILFVVDASNALDKEDIKIFENTKGKKVIVVLNKIDLGINEETEKFFDEKGVDTIKISALKGENIEKIDKKIYNIISNDSGNELNDVLVSNERHKGLLNDAYKSVENALSNIDMGFEVDMVSIDINSALEYLGEITGENTSEQVIDDIFKNFCVGK